MSYLNKLKLISEAQPAMQPNKKKVPGSTKSSSKKEKDPEKDKEDKPNLVNTFSSSAKTAFTSPEEIGSKLGGGALGHTLGTARTLAGAAAGVAKPLVSAGLKTAGKYIKKGFTSLFSKAKGKPAPAPTEKPKKLSPEEINKLKNTQQAQEKRKLRTQRDLSLGADLSTIGKQAGGVKALRVATGNDLAARASQDRIKKAEAAKKELKAAKEKASVKRSRNLVVRSEALRGLDTQNRRELAKELRAKRKQLPTFSSRTLRQSAIDKVGTNLGNQKMKANVKKNLRGAALTSSNKKFDKKVGIPLRKAMEYAHRINSYQGALIQEMRLSYINLFKNVN